MKRYSIFAEVRGEILGKLLEEYNTFEEACGALYEFRKQYINVILIDNYHQ